MGVRGHCERADDESKPGGITRVQHHHEKGPKGRVDEIQLRASSSLVHRGSQIPTPVCRKTSRNFGIFFKCFSTFSLLQ